jgi:hypothetical protein
MGIDDYDADGTEKFRPRSGAADAADRVAHRVGRLLERLLATGKPSPGYTTTGVPMGTQAKSVLMAASGRWIQPRLARGRDTVFTASFGAARMGPP